MMHAVIILAGAPIAFVSGSPLLAVLIGLVAGCCSVLAGFIWPRATPTYIDPVSRPRPATRKGQLLFAGAVATFGIGCFWLGLATSIGDNVLVHLPSLYFGGLAQGIALAILLTERRTREAHNRWVAAMSLQPDSEWKS